jgi:hypothetical protein
MCPRNGSIFSRGLKAPIPKIPKGLFAQSECFIVRGLRVSDLTITEGQLLVVEASELNTIRQKLTPSARLAPRHFRGCVTVCYIQEDQVSFDAPAGP